ILDVLDHESENRLIVHVITLHAACECRPFTNIHSSQRELIPPNVPRSICQSKYPLSDGCLAEGPSAIEYPPANVVSEPLVVQNKLANLGRKLFTLPMAFEPTEAFLLISRSCRAHRLDRVGRSTELMCGNV